MNHAEWGLLLLLSALWGGSFFFVELAVRELPPMTIVFVRVALAALVLWPIFRHMGYSLPGTVRDWMPFLVMGLLNNVLPFSLLTAGQTLVTAGLASILTAMAPLFGVVAMACARQEKLSWLRVAGVLLGVAGVAVLSGFQASADYSQTIGIVLCLAAAMCYGLAALWGRLHLYDVAPLKSATLQLICSSFVMAAVFPIFDRPWTLSSLGIATWLSLAGLGILSTAWAYIVYFQILVRAGASNAILVTLLIPVSATFLGAAFLDEPVRGLDIAGALVIGLGLLFIDGRIFRLLRRRPTA